MTQTRYKEELHTPGEYKPGAAEIIRGDPAVLAEWNEIQTRRQELDAKQTAVNGEQDKIETDLGKLVAAEGGDYKEATDRLRELRSEAEALQAGIDYLVGQAGLMKRLNHWLD